MAIFSAEHCTVKPFWSKDSFCKLTFALFSSSRKIKHSQNSFEKNLITWTKVFSRGNCWHLLVMRSNYYQVMLHCVHISPIVAKPIPLSRLTLGISRARQWPCKSHCRSLNSYAPTDNYHCDKVIKYTCKQVNCT